MGWGLTQIQTFQGIFVCLKKGRTRHKGWGSRQFGGLYTFVGICDYYTAGWFTYGGKRWLLQLVYLWGKLWLLQLVYLWGKLWLLHLVYLWGSCDCYTLYTCGGSWECYTLYICGEVVTFLWPLFWNYCAWQRCGDTACTELHYTVLDSIKLICVAGTVLHCTVLHCTLLCWSALYYSPLHCTTLCTTQRHWTYPGEKPRSERTEHSSLCTDVCYMGLAVDCFHSVRLCWRCKTFMYYFHWAVNTRVRH